MPPRQSVVHEERSPYETDAEYRRRTGRSNWTKVPATEARLRNSRLKDLQKTGGKPLKGVNFEPKRVRKAKRKALLRTLVVNKVADVQAERADRQLFFRNLRLMKITRRKIAQEMGILREQLRVLEQTVGVVENQHPTVDLRLIDETHDLVHSAYKAVALAADEYWRFSRQRIYYVKELAA